MSQPARFDAVRRRLRITRYAIGALAAGTLAGGALVVRAAHPGSQGQHSAKATTAAVPGESSSVLSAAAGLGDSEESGQSNSSVSPAPAAAPPVAQSAGS